MCGNYANLTSCVCSRDFGYFTPSETTFDKETLDMIRNLVVADDSALDSRSLCQQLAIVEELLKDILQSVINTTSASFQENTQQSSSTRLMNLPLAGLEDFDMSMISTKTWKPTLVAEADNELSTNGWFSTLCFPVISDHGLLHFVAVPQYGKSTTTSHPLDSRAHEKPEQYFAATLALNGIGHVRKVSIYHAEEDAPKQHVPALVLLTASPTPQLVKIPLHELQFHLLASVDSRCVVSAEEVCVCPRESVHVLKLVALSYFTWKHVNLLSKLGLCLWTISQQTFSLLHVEGEAFVWLSSLMVTSQCLTSRKTKKLQKTKMARTKTHKMIQESSQN